MIHDAKNKWDFSSYCFNPNDDQPRLSLQEMLFSVNETTFKRNSLRALFHTNRSRSCSDLPQKAVSASTDSLDKREYSDTPRGPFLLRFFPPSMIVMMRCLFNIFGVVLFTRLTTVFGMVGLGFGVLLVVISETVAFLTALSLSAVVTNGKVESGGIYFLISRALGPVAGFTIGMQFFISNTISVALYLLGFAEAFCNIFSLSFLFSKQILAAAAAVAIFFFCAFGFNIVLIAQVLLVLPILVVSICSIFGGMIYWQVRGGNPFFEGFGLVSMHENNIVPSWETFFRAFSLFFPGTLGMMAGAHSAHKIPNAERSLPKGTLWAILLSSFVYLSLGVLSCFSVGNLNLQQEKLIFAELSFSRWIVFIGILFSTVSQASTNFSLAPDILVRVAEDNLVPALSFFKGDKGRLKAQILSLVIALAFVIPGNFDFVAPIVTSAAIMTYSVINVACFIQSQLKTPNWRPKFRYYNAIVSLVTAIVYLVAMFMIHYISASVSVVVTALFALLITVLKPKVDWGSVMTSVKLEAAVSALRNLQHSKFPIKFYRLQLLVLCGKKRFHLASFARFLLKKGKTICTLSYIIQTPKDLNDFSHFFAFNEAKKRWLESMAYYKTFLKVVAAKNLVEGMSCLVQATGVSKVEPNTVLLGYKTDWRNNKGGTETYVSMLRQAMLFGKGVIILRNFSDFDFASVFKAKTVDVWWLDDDGGLCILVPYIISLNDSFENFKIRVLVSKSESNISVAHLLSKLRIPADVICVDLEYRPQNLSPEILESYSKLLGKRPQTVLSSSRNKTMLCYAQAIAWHSSKTFITFITCPVPTFNTDPLDYMATLEILSYSLQRVVFVRGQHESVLTYEL